MGGFGVFVIPEFRHIFSNIKMHVFT